MNAPDFLTFLFDAIALSFITIATIDFITGLVQLWQIAAIAPPATNPSKSAEPFNSTGANGVDRSSNDGSADLDRYSLAQQQWLFDEKADLESEPVTEPPAPPVESALAPELPAVPPSSEEILQDVDIEHLQLRPARKIARALGIAQKVNGKDQPLSWLKAQIKARLQQPQEVPAEALERSSRFVS